LFPTTDDSGTVIDCLLGEARRLGLHLHRGQAAIRVERSGSGFVVSPKTGLPWRCDRLLLATGSSPAGYRLAQTPGHSLVPPVPSLFTFTLADPELRALAGVAVEGVALKLRLEEQPPLHQRGPLLITHWGLSGPAILKLSAYGAIALHRQHYQARLEINWLPQLSQEQVRQTLLELQQSQGKRWVASFSPFPLPRRLWQYLAQHRAGLPPHLPWASLAKGQRQSLVDELTGGIYDIVGKGVFKEEFVTCGGVELREVNFKTLESRLCPGLYLAGEILNIDGLTGGFNFQNAWTTGWLAGRAMAASCLERKTSAPDQTQGLARSRQND
ncbi:MAG TPA: aminoacetone oxidase family FAD-binding enzyme, partial [Leptolyngbyaceae cyanobacterium M65_K2018_010]|nr:aminoacetone oxidase family FAD-binding enzyme [Leptolyngbyaceae cyanobacterium M65_K2018_010]